MTNLVQFAEGVLVHAENYLKRFEREPQPSFNAPVEAAPQTEPEATPDTTPDTSGAAAPVDPQPEAAAPKEEDAAKDESKE